jgi:ring-1,2-phenylacetyl-CoA epoxidase subunit PaaD
VTAVTSTATTADLWELIAAVPDPELPMITIEELGVLRDVRVGTDGHVVVEITPTYSGCPAMDAIRADVSARLAAAGYEDAEVRLVLAPAWTTDWITEAGRAVLRRHGIAPPHPAGPVMLRLSVRCPRCGSPDTRELSRFGSTACKALWSCQACLEPFDHVKAI